jgi:hypothetical protein
MNTDLIKVLFIIVDYDRRYRGIQWLELNKMPEIDEVFEFGGFSKYKVFAFQEKAHGYHVFLLERL